MKGPKYKVGDVVVTNDLFEDKTINPQARRGVHVITEVSKSEYTEMGSHYYMTNRDSVGGIWEKFLRPATKLEKTLK